MPGATYEFKIDTKRDGTYSASIDDLSQYVLGANWNEGLDRPYASVAPPARMTVQLRNENGEFTRETLGAERVYNGVFFLWSGGNPTGWTVTGEVASDPEVSNVPHESGHGVSGSNDACNLYCSSAGATISISQNVLTIGKTYKVTFKLTYVSAGGLAIYNGSTRVSPPYQVVGEYTCIFNATSAALTIQNWYATNATLDNVSCVECTGPYANLLKIGTLGRMRTVFSGTTTSQFIGRLIKKTPSVGRVGNRIITLEFEDPTTDMMIGDYKPDFEEGITVDAAIDPVFDNAKIAFPYSHSYWMLGIAGASELGASTYIFSPAATTFDTAYTTLDFVGDIADTTGVGINPQMFIQQMVDAEMGGRFWFDPRAGAFTFHNRNRDVLNETIAATVGDTDFEADKTTMVNGDDLENQTTINFQPRDVGADTTVIWQAQSLPLQIGVGQVYKTTASYTDLSNGSNRMGAKDVVKPEYGTDIIGGIGTDGGGATAKNRIVFSVEVHANAAEWTISNIHGDYPVYLSTLQLRGTPITFYEPKSVTSLNGDSIRENVLAQNSLPLPAISDENLAQNYADYRVSKFGTPSQHFERIGFYANNSVARMTDALTLTIGSRITVEDSWTGHDADYIIVGATHQVTMGGDNQHVTTWIVKPQARETFWLLGVAGRSELGRTTRPGF